MNIEEQHLEEIEVLLNQSLKGIHHLFDNDQIAHILSKPTEELDFFTFENMDRVQELFSQLVGFKTIYDKQAFLQNLDAESFEILLRTYFHIVENTLLNNTDFRH